MAQDVYVETPMDSNYHYEGRNTMWDSKATTSSSMSSPTNGYNRKLVLCLSLSLTLCTHSIATHITSKVISLSHIYTYMTLGIFTNIASMDWLWNIFTHMFLDPVCNRSIRIHSIRFTGLIWNPSGSGSFIWLLRFSSGSHSEGPNSQQFIHGYTYMAKQNVSANPSHSHWVVTHIHYILRIWKLWIPSYILSKISHLQPLDGNVFFSFKFLLVLLRFHMQMC